MIINLLQRVERGFRVIHKSCTRSLRTGEAMFPTVIMIITKRSKFIFKLFSIYFEEKNNRYKSFSPTVTFLKLVKSM